MLTQSLEAFRRIKRRPGVFRSRIIVCLWLLLLLSLLLCSRGLNLLPFCLLSLDFRPESLDVLTELLVPILQFELVELGSSDLTCQEVVLHLKLLIFFLQRNEFFLALPNLSVNLTALVI